MIFNYIVFTFFFTSFLWFLYLRWLNKNWEREVEELEWRLAEMDVELGMYKEIVEDVKDLIWIDDEDWKKIKSELLYQKLKRL